MRLKTFGGISIDGATAVRGGAAGQRRPLALLLFLAAAGNRETSRDKLLALLWPDSDSGHARKALRQTMYALRRDLAAPDLFCGTAAVRLNPERLQSDLAEFDAALGRNDRETIVSLYTGPLADGFHLSGALEFERWLEGERHQRARQFVAAAEWLANEATQSGNHAAAAALWRNLAVHAPLNGQVALQLIRALAEVGDRAGALQHARMHEATLREEFGAVPDAAILELVARLRTPLGNRAAGARQVTVQPLPAPDPPPRPPVDSVSFPPELPVHQGTPRHRRLVLKVLASAGTLAVLAAGAGYYVHRTGVTPSDPGLIAVAPFTVYDAGLSLWREGIMDVLSHNLDGSGPLRSVAPSVVLSTWKGRGDREAAVDLARASGAAMVIYGHVVRSGADSARLVASVLHVSSGRSAEVQHHDALARMDRLTDSITVGLLRQINGWLPIGASSGASIERITSLEALKSFLHGEQFFRRAEWDSARVHYEHSISRDSTFPLALRRIGSVLGWQQLVSDSLAESYLLRAGALNQGLGLRDSLLVLADSLAAAATASSTSLEEWPLSRRLLAVADEATRLYPKDPEVWFTLGEARYHFGFGPVRGVHEAATLDAFDRAIALDSAFAPAYLHVAELALNLEGPHRAREYLQAFLRRHAALAASGKMHLLDRVLTEGVSSVNVQRMIDTLPRDVTLAVRVATRRWVDSTETALRLSRALAAGRGAPSRNSLLASRVFLTRTLAEQLAFRGHVREAHRLTAQLEAPILFEVALLGGAPTDTVDARISRAVREERPLAGMALRWWAAGGDTGSLATYLNDARRRASSGGGRLMQLAAGYDTAAAHAYLALVAGDTAEALRRLSALPDTLCVRCYLDRLTRAELRTARGQLGAALADLEEPLVAIQSPIEVLFALHRARVAERLQDRGRAASAYRFVIDAWARGDPEVQPLVAEARRGLKRVER